MNIFDEFGRVDDKLVEASQRLVRFLDDRNTNVYVSLAKAALWVVAALLTAVLGVAFIRGDLSVIVQACQVVILLAVTVLGYHQYQGSRILHIIRNCKRDEGEKK